jgi:hypothetical protein
MPSRFLRETECTLRDIFRVTHGDVDATIRDIGDVAGKTLHVSVRSAPSRLSIFFVSFFFGRPAIGDLRSLGLIKSKKKSASERAKVGSETTQPYSSLGWRPMAGAHPGYPASGRAR